MWPVAIIAGGGIAGLAKGSAAVVRAKTGSRPADSAIQSSAPSRRSAPRDRDTRDSTLPIAPRAVVALLVWCDTQGRPTDVRPAACTRRGQRTCSAAGGSERLAAASAFVQCRHVPARRRLERAPGLSGSSSPATATNSTTARRGARLVERRTAAARGPRPEGSGHLARRRARRALRRSSRISATSNRRRRARRRAANSCRPISAATVSAGQLPRGTRAQGARATPVSTCCSAIATPLHYYSNRRRRSSAARPDGIYGLSNQWLDTPWPKLSRTRERFAARSRATPERRGTVRAARGSNRPARGSAAQRPARGLGARRVGTVRRTRAIWNPLLDRGAHRQRGRTVVHERRFDPAGGESGASRFAIRDGSGDTGRRR